MGSETRFIPQRTPRSTGIAQTQMVNRPATMGVGGLTPPVTASPAASDAVRRQVTENAGGAVGASAISPSAAQTRMRAADARVELRDNRVRNRGTVLPGPPGSAVRSVELLPNVTKASGSVAVAPARIPPEKKPPLFGNDEILLLVHLVDTFEGGENTSEENKELARGLRDKIATLIPPPAAPSVI